MFNGNSVGGKPRKKLGSFRLLRIHAKKMNLSERNITNSYLLHLHIFAEQLGHLGGGTDTIHAIMC